MTNVSTVFVGALLVDQGTVPLNSGAGQFLADFIAANPNFYPGVTERPTLGPEESESLSFGAAFDLGPASVTIDYFDIDVTDRVALSSPFDFVAALQETATQNGVVFSPTDSTSQLLNALNTAGVINIADFAGAEDLVQFGFFNNDFDTNTKGVDIIATMPLDITTNGNTDLSLALNYTDTTVTRLGNIAPGRKRQLEDNLPDWRGNLTVTHDDGPWRGLVRVNYYGKFFEDHLDSNLAFPINGGQQVTVDFEVGRKLHDQFEVILGARNAFDSFPDDNPFAGVVGAKYPVTAPGGFNGGSYYLKGRFVF